MASEDAKNVAKQVLETIGSGEKVILGEILRNNGYSDNTADNPLLVTSTKSYQDVINPVIVKMEKERDRLLLALANKDLSEEKYQTMIDGLDKLTKNIQLLNGGSTERSSVIVFDSAFKDETNP
jgi:hypothetical protein